MTTDKRVEAAARAICNHVGFKWESITKEAADNYRKVAEKALAAVDAAAWQDISTAPKDRPVLTYRKAGLQAIAEYDEDFGWVVTDGMGIINVTHWQPEPIPPADQNSEDTAA